MTEKQPNQQPYPQNYLPCEDEINLIDYLRVLWKWKWLIMGGTLICAIVAAIISLQIPRIYEISTIVEPGIAGVKNDGSFIYIDSVANIGGKIDEGTYNRRIEDALHLDPLKIGVKFKSVVSKNANVVKVTSQWKEKNTDLGMKYAGQLVRFLIDDYERIVNHRKVVVDGQIFSMQNNIKKLETQSQLLVEILRDIKRRMDGLKREVNNVKNNTENLIKQRDSLLKEAKAETEMSLLLYSTTIQQNISYMNQISNQIYEFREKEKEVLREIGEMESGIDSAKTEIATLTINKEMVSNIKVIQEPEVSLHPVKPKKKQIVLLSVVVGLFFMIFLAFFIEYIKNASRAAPAGK